MKIFYHRTTLLTLLLLFGLLTTTHSQTYDFGFKRDLNIPVYDENNQLLRNAWAGGLNSVHFNAIDLNFNGIKDLVVFDSQTNKLRTFINNGTSGQVDYHYAPEFEMYFPKMYSWVKLRDFNGNGKEDIFTYGFGGIKVYKNTSTPETGLSFELYTPMLNAHQGGHFTNIMVTPVDYPSIVDIDGDGDLDIFVFFGLGTFLQYYKNMSVEYTGTTDTLWMELKHRCWGWFAEDEDRNYVTLNIDSLDPNFINWCQYNLKGDPPGFNKRKSAKHVGSTMTMLDLTNNGVMDLLLGDTDYPTILALYNEGTPDSARITHLDTFPSYDVPVGIYSLPSTDYLDLDNDGVKDLVAAPFDPGWELRKADNVDNVWFYKNIGTDSLPVFSLQTKNFLQEEMIDVGANSYPVLFDYNGNGLLDLFVGNFGVRDSSWMDPWLTLYSYYSSSITLYENTGTAANPEFTFVTDDFANVSSLGIVGAYPTFGDLTGNGKPDMLLGDTSGRLHYFENVAPAGQPMQLNYVSSNYQNIDVGMFSTPQLFDLDNNGLLDLIIGYREKRWGTGLSGYYKTSISYYRNTGTASDPQFTLITDSLGGINVNDSYHHFYNGYSAPRFYRDSNDVTYLFVGSGTGLVFYYRDIDTNINGFFGIDSNMVHTTDYDIHYSVQHFENHHNNLQVIDVSRLSTVAVGDLFGNGYPDLIVGSNCGGLHFFKGSEPLGVGTPKPERNFDAEISLFPNPASNRVFVTISNGDQSMRTRCSVYSITGQLMLQLENIGDDMIPIDIYNLPNGIYIINIDIESPFKGQRGTFNRKIVVNR